MAVGLEVEGMAKDHYFLLRGFLLGGVIIEG